MTFSKRFIDDDFLINIAKNNEFKEFEFILTRPYAYITRGVLANDFFMNFVNSDKDNRIKMYNELKEI